MGHHHYHSSPESQGQRIGWAFFLNVGFTIIEFIGGYLTNSSAIMADAIHDLGDSLSIGLAWILAKLSTKPASNTYSYGYKRFSLLGALINGLILIIGAGWILTDAIPRLSNPPMPHAEGMLGLALLGMTVNGFAAYKLRKGKSLNEKMLNWHLLEDVLGWVAVLIVSVTLIFMDWPIIDPILSILFAVFILFNVIKNTGTTLRLFLQGAPSEELSQQITETLNKIPEFKSFHHMHLWSLDGENHVLTLHVVLEERLNLESQRQLKTRLSNALSPFEISHTTVEFEFSDEPCRDAEQ